MIRARFAAGVLVLVMTAACSGISDNRPRVVVFAASSLTASFRAIAALRPDLLVQFTFDGSPTLVEQLNAKPGIADVLATADEQTMATAVARGLVASPQVFATNTAVMIVPAGNPGHITGLDASLTGRKLVVCAPSVPCGAIARTVAANAGVALRPVSEEQKVADVTGKVASGEADAGIVFVTDAQGAGAKVEILPLPGADAVVASYPIALVSGSRSAQATVFVDLVTSTEGRRVLTSYGFGVR